MAVDRSLTALRDRIARQIERTKVNLDTLQAQLDGIEKVIGKQLDMLAKEVAPKK